MKNSLKVERAKDDLTQAELAEKVGVARQTINGIEQGHYIPSTLLALKIAHVLDRKVESLFHLDDEDWD